MNAKYLGLFAWSFILFFSVSLFGQQQQHKFIDSFGLQDLNIDSFFEIIDRTQTTVGKKELRDLFENPLSDKKSLINRQKVVKTLVNDKKLRTKIRNSLDAFHQHEAHFKLHDNPIQEALTQSMIKHLYFQTKHLQKFNENAVALDCLHIYEKSMLFSPLLEHLLLHVVKDAFSHGGHGHHNHGHHNHGHGDHNHGHHGHHDHTCSVSLLEGMFKSLGVSSHMLQKVMWFFIGAHFLMHALSAKEMVDHIQSKNIIISDLHHRLAHFKQAMIASKETIQAVSAHPQLNTFLNNSTYQEMCTHLNQDGPLKDMTSTLESYNFDTEKSIGFFSRVGHTLSAYKQLETVHSDFNMILKGIGQLDAYVSLAELYDDYATEGQACFVNFIEDTHPVIDIESFYHPLIIDKSVVTNSCSFGEQGLKHGIITGPNKAGKSTYIKALALNVCCAHVGGFMFAKKASLTPFDMIVTYINIHDDIMHDQSKFVAEIMRADQCLERLESLNDHEFGLCIIDDSLFSSTNHEQTVQAAYNFVKNISNLKRVISLTVTHLPELTKLEEDMPGVFKNYRIKLASNNENMLQSTFMLEEGISDVKNALSLIQTQGYNDYALS